MNAEQPKSNKSKDKLFLSLIRLFHKNIPELITRFKQLLKKSSQSKRLIPFDFTHKKNQRKLMTRYLKKMQELKTKEKLNSQSDTKCRSKKNSKVLTKLTRSSQTPDTKSMNTSSLISLTSWPDTEKTTERMRSLYWASHRKMTKLHPAKVSQWQWRKTWLLSGLQRTNMGL